VRHPTGHGEEHWRRGHLVSRARSGSTAKAVYRAAFAAHPRVVPLLTTAPVRAPEIIAAHEEMVGLLDEVGVPVDQAMRSRRIWMHPVCGQHWLPRRT